MMDIDELTYAYVMRYFCQRLQWVGGGGGDSRESPAKWFETYEEKKFPSVENTRKRVR